MIPVKYPAGRTAFVFHNQTERVPYQYAYQIADVEKHGYHKEPDFIDNIGIIQHTYCTYQKNPNQHNLVCRIGRGNDVVFQRLIVYLLPYGLKPIGKELL